MQTPATDNDPLNVPLIVRLLGTQLYPDTWAAMQRFTDQRSAETQDEIWLVEHPPVFTQGTAGKPEHVLNPGTIPVVQTDRGGQVTYHGPGQLVAYLLVDLSRRKMGVREFVTRIEQAVIDLLAAKNLNARGDRAAPGVYLGEKKIASIGLRVRRGCSYHGLSLNVDMDLEPFSRINPCGYANLQITHMKHHLPDITSDHVAGELVEHLSRVMGYNGAHISSAHDVNEGSP